MSDDATPLLNGDRDALGEYVREMADLMGLRDWMMGIADDPPDNDDANAQVDVPYGRWWASIKFNPSWPERDPEDLRRTVAHELVHCHLWSMHQRVCDLHDLLGSTVYQVLNKAFTENLEHAVDGIAYAWAESLPLPVKADEGEAA